MPTKRLTSFNPEPANSRLDAWYRSDGAEVLAKKNWWYKFRKPSKPNTIDVPDRLDIDLCQTYGIYTITFGEWVSMFDRLNFCAALKPALEDLASIVLVKKSPRELGKGELTIDWGGRGRKGAAGLYSSGYTTLHLRRFTRPDKLLAQLEDIGQNPADYLAKYFKPIRGQFGQRSYQLNEAGYVWILGSSGFGSFAHEFGHFMDNYLGKKLKAPTGFATGTGVFPYYSQELTFKEIAEAFFQKQLAPDIQDITDLKIDSTLFTLRNRILEIFLELYYTRKPNKSGTGGKYLYSPSPTLSRLWQYKTQTGGKWTYWGSFIEVWARLFESYIQYKLLDKGIQNTLLVSDYKKFEIQIKVVDGKEITAKVGAMIYPTRADVKKLYKKLDGIMAIFAST